MAFDQIEPFGDVRADIRNALLCQVVMAPNQKKGATLPSIEDFMLFHDSGKDERMDEDAIRDVCKRITARFKV